MPEIDAFLGLSFCLYFFDNKQHKLPHIHVKYGSHEVIIAIETGKCLEGYLPNKQRKRAESHIAAHRVQLMDMWHKAVKGQNPGKLEDLC
ncbi:type II toxin-antitoxin system toxin DhiT [Rheinheimera sp. NSM]|uniref:type II toxin-antitoxin system toxin DhiT n=1 Tax=Rheinheimera sp. NSM TaxID=3457884 RepID=UPI004036CFBD